jgi:hypothetical protein
VDALDAYAGAAQTAQHTVLDKRDLGTPNTAEAARLP